MNASELIKDFTLYLKRRGKSKSTLIAYENDIRQLAESNVNKDLTEFNEADIRSGLVFLQTSKTLSAKTISRKLNSIRTFYKYLAEKKIIHSSPAENISHPKFKAKKQRILSRMEFLALREISRENLRLFTMIELLLQTGIKIGEISRLKVKDVNLNGKFAEIFIETFASSPSRRVPLNSKIQYELEKYIRENNFKKKPESPLFSTKTGKSIQIRNIRSSIDRALIKAKIRNACVNDLRNTFIVHQLNNGMSLSHVAGVVGHKNTITTSRYLELLPKKFKPNGTEQIVEL